MKKIFETVKKISLDIDNLIKTGELGYSTGQNITGDTQLKLDIASDMIIEEHFRKLESVKSIISEEKDDVLELNNNGKYTICYDPLDGSSIVDANFAVGSIFGIYNGNPKGSTLAASIYVVYGPRIEIVAALPESKPVRYRYTGSTWEDLDEFSLSAKGKHIAPGGTQKNWLPKHKTFVESLFAEGYRLRYSGGMVPDLHHLLVKGGGIFSYPPTSDVPQGKLRMLFEVLPFALVFESAGGMAVDDKGRRLLDLSPSHYHDTVPCYFGSDYEIEALKKAYGVA